MSDENIFNCVDECGLYEDNDRLSPLLHIGCSAMTESEKCKRNFDDGEKKKKKKKKSKSQNRIVGGEETKHAMPWMVKLILIIWNIMGGLCQFFS